MKKCSACGQIVAQQITTCPACGSRLVAGMTSIDDYSIRQIIHEGRSSLVCRAVKGNGDKNVTLRIFTDQSGVDARVAQRLQDELKTLAKLPQDLFVQHYAVKQSREGYWYRVSEWVDADPWGTVFVSGILNDQRRMVTLFYNIATALDILHHHDHFMPYLILDDILIPKNQARHLSVKINYKLSRFLNARATHHGPMLQKLIDCHPDIVNQRAIDFRSGIWSLGKIFVELLTADHNLTRFSAKLDELQGLDPELKVLIKVMLSDDPDLRPQSMAKVTASLGRILEQIPHKRLYPPPDKKKPKLLREITWFKRVVVILIILILGIIAANTLIVMEKQPEEEAGFSRFLDTHTKSIGFLMVEYWLQHNDQVIYKNKVEGTAFLVDKEGYLLTNRHVACPWLEDPTLFRIRQALSDKPLEFKHRMFLWFEGARAFNRIPGLTESTDLADAYFLGSAFRSDGKSNLRVVGVPRGHDKTGDRIRSPFKHDFAVLKIDTPPKGILPLPLETIQAPSQIKRLSPVIIMGFPLGSQTQDAHINASITRGHVRRTSREIIQVDSSIYKGNSGGPAVNTRGRVIGIASGVVTDQPLGQLPIRTPLSDFGLVLPISRPARFMASLKNGHPKWDGLLDFTLEQKLDKVLALALAHDYTGAAALAHTLLETSKDPALLFSAALLELCGNQPEKSRDLFTRVLSIEGDNTMSQLMLYTIDWIGNTSKSKHLTRDLLTMNWQDADEFSGYLARVLGNAMPMDPDMHDYENASEKAWRLYIDGLLAEKDDRLARAMACFKEVILTAGANDQLYFLAFSRLDTLLDRQAAFAENRATHKAEHEALWQTAAENREKAKAHYARAVELIETFESSQTSHEDKLKTIEALLTHAPENRTIMGRAAFYHAMNSQWDQALAMMDRFFEHPCRETGLSLSLGLLKGQVLRLAGQPKEAAAHLARFYAQTRDPWYRILIKHIKEPRDARDLAKLAGGNPAKLITLHTALGLQAEVEKEKDRAIHHYRDALGTYLDSWNEYDLALARIIRFRQVRTED